MIYLSRRIGWSLLHWSAYFNRVEVAQLLVCSRADVNMPDRYLFMMSGMRMLSALTILRRTGLTPLKYAIDYSKNHVAEYLRSVGGRE